MAEQKLERTESVAKQGVKALGYFMGYDDYSKKDTETGEVKVSIGYHFMKVDGFNAKKSFSNPTIVTFWDKSMDYLNFKDYKPMDMVGLSLTISSGQGGSLFTQVQGILSKKQTEALILIYGDGSEETSKK